MENRAIARCLRETADLLEVAGESSFRVRSYRRAADTVDNCPTPVAALAGDRKRLQSLPGIGPGIGPQIAALVETGKMPQHQELLQRFRPEMLDLLRVSGLGPRTVSLIWSTFRAATLDEVEKLAREGKLRDLPRLGAKAEEKILHGIAAYRILAGRFRRDQADEIVALFVPALEAVPGVSGVHVTGSYRRGRETVGDLDFLVCGDGFPAAGRAVVERFVALPRVDEVLAQGPNKTSVRLHGGLQADLRLTAPESLGAALQYFTGSQAHNVQLRQMALRQGCSLNEYGLFRLGPGGEPGERVAATDEAEIYRALGLDWIPPELREDRGEFDAAAQNRLPRLLEVAQIRGDVHMHTTATDGRCEILEMATAAAARGYEYIAITDHSQALAMANGLDETRMLQHVERIRAAERRFQESHAGFRILAGVEVDILSDGRLDLADDVLAQLDLVIGSVHSRFDQPIAETTARLLRAVENPHLDLLGHPTGRLLLRREPYQYDFEAVLDACARHGVAMEINASPERLDLNDTLARRCAARDIGIVINTDAHALRHLEFMRYGVAVARRAWLEAGQVWNTLPVAAFTARLRRAQIVA